jgi:hypothetical protein
VISLKARSRGPLTLLKRGDSPRGFYDDSHPRHGGAGSRGVIVVATLIWMPAYRLFFAISIVAAVLVALGLQLWHKFRPVRQEDIQNKRPLGL